MDREIYFVAAVAWEANFPGHWAPAGCQPQHGVTQPGPAASGQVKVEHPMLGQVASSGFPPAVSICFQINLPILYFANCSLKACRENRLSVLLFVGRIDVFYIDIYLYPYLYLYRDIDMTKRKYTSRPRKKVEKDRFSLKILHRLIWTRSPDPKPSGMLEVQSCECSNLCKLLNYRERANHLQTISIYC